MQSAFGVDHGVVSKGIPTGLRGIEHAAGQLKSVPGRGLPGKRAKQMTAVTTGSSPGRRRLGGGAHLRSA